MAESSPTPNADVLAGVPPLSRIEPHRCPKCESWIDPTTGFLERPYTHPQDGSFCRFMYLDCTEHGCGAWLFNLRWTGMTWLIDQAPVPIPASLRPTLRFAFNKRDGDHAPGVRLFLIGKGETFKK
jgi:hypothetical protein